MDASNINSIIQELSVNVSTVSSPPIQYRAHRQTARTRFYCRGDVGVKVLVDPNLTRDQVVQALQFEQKVSHSLPSSCSQRRVLRVDTFQDLPAMYFKWVEGVDMGELLKPEPDETEKNQFSMDTRLQLALAITKAVCDFHDAGVFHGNLNLENVIMDFNEGTRNYKATLIDYSKSVIMSDASHNTLDEQDRHAFFEEKKHNDLSDLGVILYYVLSNNNIPDALGEEVENSSNDVDAQGIKRGRHDVQTPNLPLYLASLVSALLGHTRDVEGHRRLVYKSSREVLLDLQLAAQKPGIYLKVQFWTEMLFKPLDVPHDSFHGRRTELSILQQSYNTMMEGGSKPCALVVSGCAGAGKTSLLSQLATPLQQSNGYMVVCKFNQSDSPDTILGSGFDLFFESIVKNDNDDAKQQIKMRIEEALGERASALEESIPHLGVLLGCQSPAERGNSDSQALKLRWKFLLSTLVRAISSQSHPIVLVFEDLHWADEDVLDTIQLIVLGSKTRYCLFCMSYRDTNDQPKLSELTEGLHNQGVLFWNIKLGTIEKESVDCLVSEALSMPLTLIKPLSRVLRNKTGGIIFFITNFLKSLYEEALIYFNQNTVRWDFDLDKIMQKEISSDIIEFLSERIKRLPRSIQTGLKVAACLGSTFDLAVFQKANASPENFIDDFISLTTESGFIHEFSPNHFRWSHDQVEEAAYSLIPTNERPSTHLLIGTRIYLNSRPEEIQDSVQHIASCMNIGMALLDSQERRTELAKLNLMAGEQSKKSSEFYSAVNYCMTGIELLDENWQDTSYDLAMKLFNLATQMIIVTGHDMAKFEDIIQKPLLNANNLSDKMPSTYNLIRFLCLSGRFEEALGTCYSILNDGSEVFPEDVTPEFIREEILKTDSMLARFPVNDLPSLPSLTDPTRLWMVKIMATTMLIHYVTNAEVAPLVGCRMVQSSLTHGWCADAAYGLYSFGQGLISVTNKIDEGCFWVQEGIALLNHLNDKNLMPVLEALYHEHIAFWKQPVQASCDALQRTHGEALMEGQMEFAMSSAFHACRHSFMSGSNLATLNHYCIAATHKMALLKQVLSIMLHVSLHCLVLKLMGETDVSHAFTVIATIFSSEDELLQHGISTGKKTLVQYIYTHRLILSYWLQNYDEAIQMAELYGKNHMRFLDICHVFYQGLTALRLAQRKDADEEKWTRMGETAVSSFKKWKDFSSWNFENKYTLLLAELHYVKGDYKAAEEQYKASIASAQSHRFLHEEGLAMESLGLLYRRSGNEKGAKEMFMNARTCYEKWGATAVVTRLDSLLESL